jgi:hypothetical protein
MSLEQYKDSWDELVVLCLESKTKMWSSYEKSVVAAAHEIERLTAELEKMTETARQYTELASRGIYYTIEELAEHDKKVNLRITAERDELLKNQAKRDLESEAKGVKDLISNVGVFQGPESVGCYLDYDMVIDELNKLIKQAEESQDD